MTLKDIAIFKHFIAEKDLRKPFINVYHASKSFAKLPEHIETYFSNVEPLVVIIKAARVVQPNATYGYDFWQGLHQDWKVYYTKHSGMELSEEKLPILEGYYHILRENWNDKIKPWRYEQLEDAQCRNGLPLAPLVQEEPKNEVPDVETEEDDDDELEFVDITKATKSGWRLMEDEISFSHSKKGHRILFNQEYCSVIREFGECYARLAQTKSGDAVIQLNKENGINVSLGYRKKRTGNVCISSLFFCNKLDNMLHIGKEYQVLHAEIIKQTDTIINFKIKK